MDIKERKVKKCHMCGLEFVALIRSRRYCKGCNNVTHRRTGSKNLQLVLQHLKEHNILGWYHVAHILNKNNIGRVKVEGHRSMAFKPLCELKTQNASYRTLGTSRVQLACDIINRNTHEVKMLWLSRCSRRYISSRTPFYKKELFRDWMLPNEICTCLPCQVAKELNKLPSKVAKPR